MNVFLPSSLLGGLCRYMTLVSAHVIHNTCCSTLMFKMSPMSFAVIRRLIFLLLSRHKKIFCGPTFRKSAKTSQMIVFAVSGSLERLLASWTKVNSFSLDCKSPLPTHCLLWGVLQNNFHFCAPGWCDCAGLDWVNFRKLHRLGMPLIRCRWF